MIRPEVQPELQALNKIIQDKVREFSDHWNLFLIISEIHFGQVKKKQELKKPSQNENSKKTKQSRINARRRESVEAKVVFQVPSFRLKIE